MLYGPHSRSPHLSTFHLTTELLDHGLVSTLSMILRLQPEENGLILSNSKRFQFKQSSSSTRRLSNSLI